MRIALSDLGQMAVTLGEDAYAISDIFFDPDSGTVSHLALETRPGATPCIVLVPMAWLGRPDRSTGRIALTQPGAAIEDAPHWTGEAEMPGLAGRAVRALTGAPACPDAAARRIAQRFQRLGPLIGLPVRDGGGVIGRTTDAILDWDRRQLEQVVVETTLAPHGAPQVLDRDDLAPLDPERGCVETDRVARR